METVSIIADIVIITAGIHIIISLLLSKNNDKKNREFFDRMFEFSEEHKPNLSIIKDDK